MSNCENCNIELDKLLLVEVDIAKETFFKRKGLKFLCGKCKKLSKVKIEWLKTWYNINIQVFNKWRFLCLSL